MCVNVYSCHVLTGICFAQRLIITRDATDAHIDKLVDKLLNEELAKGVVMFVNEDNTKRVLQSVMRKNRSSELSFLASDSWGAKIHPVLGQEATAEGAVTILPKRRIIPGWCWHYFMTFFILTLHDSVIDWYICKLSAEDIASIDYMLRRMHGSQHHCYM